MQDLWKGGNTYFHRLALTVAGQLLRPVLGVTRLSTVDLSVSREIGRLGDIRGHARGRWKRNLKGRLAQKHIIGLIGFRRYLDLTMLYFGGI